MFLRTACGLAFLAIAVAAHAADDDKDKLGAELVGSYTFVSGERSGEEIAVEDLRGSRVKITAKEIIVTDDNGKHTYAATYTLDTTRNPWRIDMVSTEPAKDQRASGLIAVADDRVKLIYSLVDGERPTEFKTRDQQLLFILKAAPKVAGAED